MMEKELGECFIEYCAIMLCTQTLCMCVRELSNMLLTEKKMLNKITCGVMTTKMN